MAIKLPTTKTVSKLSPENISVLLYGPPKVGKTSMVAQMENVLVIGTEKRHKHLSLFLVYPENWKEFTEYVEALEKECPYKAIAIDTIGDLYRMCESYVCENMGIEHPGDAGYGKGWSAVDKEFKEWVSRLTFLDVGVWFISHAKKIDTKTSIKELTTVEPDIPSTGRKIIRALVDQILFMCIDTYNRKRVKKDGQEEMETFMEPTMLCAPTEDIEAGDSLGILPARIRLGSSAEEGYNRYREFFNKAIKE